FRRPLFLIPAPSMGAGWGGGDVGARVVFAEVTSEEACPGIEQTAAGSVIPRSGLQPHRRSATCARRLARSLLGEPGGTVPPEVAPCPVSCPLPSRSCS